MPWGAIGGAAIGALGSLIGGSMSANAAAQNAAQQYANQKEFAQNGVRWKVADAQAAGIHPLAALGAQTFSYNPVMVGSSDRGVGEALAQMGQGVSRAVEAKALQEERALDRKLKEAQIDNVMAQTDAVRAQAQASQQAITKSALPPAMPKVNESENTSSYAVDVGPLMQLSRLGNVFVEHINPNLSDAITESMVKNAAVMASAEGQASRTKRDAFNRLSPYEKAQIRAGNAVLERIPGVGWQFLFAKHMMPKIHKDGSASGKFLPLQYW